MHCLASGSPSPNSHPVSTVRRKPVKDFRCQFEMSCGIGSFKKEHLSTSDSVKSRLMALRIHLEKDAMQSVPAYGGFETESDQADGVHVGAEAAEEQVEKRIEHNQCREEFDVSLTTSQKCEQVRRLFLPP